MTKYYCLNRKKWATEYRFLWIFKIYKLTLFGQKPKWSFLKSKNPMYKPNTTKPRLTLKQAKQMWGNNRYIYPLNPYIIKD